jgi:ribosomal protein L37AE/L43A
MSGSRADWSCPQCGSDAVFHAQERIFKCHDCGQAIHEKVGHHQDVLMELAESDLPVAEIADLLLSISHD